MIKHNKGLQPVHIGVRFGQNFAPLSSFALAEIGVSTRATLEEMVSKVNKAGITGETPFLREVMNSSRRKRLSLWHLRELAKTKYPDSSMVDETALIPVNAKGQYATRSSKDMISFQIRDRKQTSQDEIIMNPVKIINPFSDEPYDITRMHLRGGSQYIDTKLSKHNHWSRGLPHEQEFLSDLPKTARERYDQIVEVIDYYRACALIGLDKIVKSGKLEFIGSQGLHEGEKPFVPFDFSKAPHLALEAFVMYHAEPQLVKKVQGKRKVTLLDLDSYLTGKNGFVTSELLEAQREGYALKEVVNDSKNMSNYMWAIVQAWEKHFTNKGRRFAGYSLEFTGTPYQTSSIVFDLPQFSRQEQEKKDISMRIVYNDHFSLPYVIYKNFKPTFNPGELGNKDPVAMINIPRNKQGQHYESQVWIERDWRTGRMATCSLFVPSEEILTSASELSTNAGRGIHKETLLTKYRAHWAALHKI